MILVRTPFRISLFGGGTDYPEYFNDYEGKTIALAINKYGYVSVNFPKIRIGEKFHLRYSQSESVNTIDEINHPSIREVLQYYDECALLNYNWPHPENALRFGKTFKFPDIIDINYTSDLPSMSGMGSSSSFTVGLINALHNSLFNIVLSKYNLASTAIEIERERIKESVGWQDQIIAAYGGINSISFKNNNFKVTDSQISEEVKDMIESNVYLVYTGLHRKASDLAIKQIERIKDTKSELNDMFYLTKMMEQSLLSDDIDLMEKEIGEALDQSWKIKRTLTDSISNKEIDELYEYGIKNQATGGKLLGAGAGGFFLFWVPRNMAWAFTDTLDADGIRYLQIKIDQDGSKIIYKER